MTRDQTMKMFGALAGAAVMSAIAFACSSSSGGTTSDDTDSGAADLDSGGAGDDGSDDSGSSPATSVPCPTGGNPSAACKATVEYCLTTGAVLDGGFYRSTDTCIVLAPGCDTCSCIDAGGDFTAQNGIGDNCKSDPQGPVVITCSDQDGAITATCTKTLTF